MTRQSYLESLQVMSWWWALDRWTVTPDEMRHYIVAILGGTHR